MHRSPRAFGPRIASSTTLRKPSRLKTLERVSRNWHVQPETRNREDDLESDCAPPGAVWRTVMRAALLKRLQRLEEVRGVACQPPEFQTGYLKELPADYFGERHIVTIG